MSLNAVEELAQPIPADDFQSLEDKIYRTIEQLKTAREAKIAAERAAARLREQVAERDEQISAMRNELVALRRDREEVRTRIEKILKQIEALTSSESES
jgi:chromosome segregation ATPase